MKILAGIAIAMALMIGGGTEIAMAGTSLSGALAGAFTFDTDNTATGLAAGLGATYRPDKVEVANTLKGGFKVEPSDLIFFTQQWFQQDASDLNITGGGISLVKAPNFELLAEGGAVFKGIGAEQFRVGAMAQADMRFVSFGKNMAMKIGGGYDGDRPLLILSLGFETD